MKSIGIVGGAGPMAGALLLKKVIGCCQTVYGCIDDEDFPKVFLVSMPFAEMLKPGDVRQQEDKVAQQLEQAVDFLVDSGVDSVAIACNTLHTFLSANAFEGIVNLIEETEREVERLNLSKVLVLCTKTTALKHGYRLLSGIFPNLDEQALVDRTIRKVLTGSFSSSESGELSAYLERMLQLDPEIDGILLGCSELSVLVDDFPLGLHGVRVIDPLEILGRKICETVFNK